jgi:2-dehydro-3-deoxyphosphogalactonate aldolase
MKLTGIKTHFVQVPPPYAGGRTFYFLKLMTDEGIHGWGEMFFLLSYSNMERSVVREIEDIFNKFLKGQNPLQREKLWRSMYNVLCCQHPDLVRMGMISAIDMALWDICGKSCGMPVYEMLGGKYRDRIRTYSYIIHPKPTEKKNFWELWHDAEAVAERAVEMAEEGFTALKYDPIPYYTHPIEGEPPAPPWQLSLDILDMAEKSVKAIREAVGNKCDILIGTHGQTTPSAAIRLAKRLEPYEPLWFEEPVPPENAREMAKVARSTTIPVATGERLTTVHEFLRLFEEGAAAIIQPDVGCCGGITEFKKIAAMAEAFYVQVAPHLYGGPVLTAASIQLATCLPNFLIQESIYDSNHFFNELVEEPFHWKEGFLIPSDKPGLGIELNEKNLARFSLI